MQPPPCNLLYHRYPPSPSPPTKTKTGHHKTTPSFTNLRSQNASRLPEGSRGQTKLQFAVEAAPLPGSGGSDEDRVCRTLCMNEAVPRLVPTAVCIVWLTFSEHSNVSARSFIEQKTQFQPPPPYPHNPIPSHPSIHDRPPINPSIHTQSPHTQPSPNSHFRISLQKCSQYLQLFLGGFKHRPALHTHATAWIRRDLISSPR